MSIHVECPECSRLYDVPDRYAGQKVRCKSCGAAMSVPTADPAVPSTPVVMQQPRRPADSRDTNPVANRGMIGWLIGGAAAFSLVLLAISFLTPLGILIGIGLFAVGMLILTVGQIFLIVTAFQEDTTQGLLVFFVPIYPLFYLFSRWPNTSTPVWFYAAGMVTALLAVPAGFGGVVATARWANATQVAETSPVEETHAAGDPFFTGGPAAGPPASDLMPPGAFSPPNFPPPNFPAPGEMPAGFPPPMEPPTGFRPGGFPPGMQPPGMHPPGLRQPGTAVENTISGEPETVTVYLRRTNSYFDRMADLTAAANESLSAVDGYVAGSVKIDLAKGTVTLKAPRHPALIPTVTSTLFRIGLDAGERPPSTPWFDPTQPRTMTLSIRGLLPGFDEQEDVDAATDELLAEIDGYVSGSVAVDVENGRVTYEAYPGTPAERFVASALLRAGINAVPDR